ncbi:MAG: alpha/beta hydrolase [Gammaproteobacteria bacterium]
MKKNIPSLYEALSHSPARNNNYQADLGIYRSAGEPEYGRYSYKAPAKGLVKAANSDGNETILTDDFEIAYTRIGDKGPIVLFLHGVPTNRRQWEDVQALAGRFCRTISIDMLGMGESTMPRMYGRSDDSDPLTQWHWVNDTDYVEKLMQSMFPGEKFVFVADDWGSGIASHYAAKYNERLLALVHMDPIAFDGYPVNEIQAIGRASGIPNTPDGDQLFQQMFGDFDQRLVQILKSMVHNRHVFNQYNMRSLAFPYVDVDYERNGKNDGVSDVAYSNTMQLNFHNIRVLSDRAAMLAPSLLLPYCAKNNPNGVAYENITVPALIMWGEYDNMMPAAQTQRFANVLGSSDVQITYIPRSGHFPGNDNPVFVADTVVNFVRRIVGRENMADIYMGNWGIWKGDESEVVKDLRQVYDIKI